MSIEKRIETEASKRDKHKREEEEEEEEERERRVNSVTTHTNLSSSGELVEG